MDLKLEKHFETIINHSHMWNWAPDLNLAKEIYKEYPNSYALLLPFFFSYLEELIRSTSTEYGWQGPNERKKVSTKLFKHAIAENNDNAELIAIISEIQEKYFSQSSGMDSGQNRNSTLHGYLHPRYWEKESFEGLILDIARLSAYAGF